MGERERERKEKYVTIIQVDNHSLVGDSRLYTHVKNLC